MSVPSAFTRAYAPLFYVAMITGFSLIAHTWWIRSHHHVPATSSQVHGPGLSDSSTPPQPQQEALLSENGDKSKNAHRALSALLDEGIRHRTDADLAEIEKAVGWDDYYRLAASAQLPAEKLESSLLKRFTVMFGLDDSSRKRLTTIFYREQDLVTASAIEHFGGASALRDYASAGGKDADDFWAALRKLRSEVRARCDVEYAEVLSSDQLEALNEHMRNDDIALRVRYDNGVAAYKVGGAGRKGH